MILERYTTRSLWKPYLKPGPRRVWQMLELPLEDTDGKNSPSPVALPCSCGHGANVAKSQTTA